MAIRAGKAKSLVVVKVPLVVVSLMGPDEAPAGTVVAASMEDR